MKTCDPMLRSPVFNDDLVQPGVNRFGTYQMVLNSQSGLSPSTLIPDNISVTQGEDPEEVSVDNTVYLPAQNLLVLTLEKGKLSNMSCLANLGEDVLLTNGSSGAAQIPGTPFLALPHSGYGASAVALELIDSSGSAVISPASGEPFTARVTVVNTADEDIPGTLSVYVKDSTASPAITRNVTAKAGTTEVFTCNSGGIELSEDEFLTASFTPGIQ